jgi:hypothetical protein
MKWLPLVVTKSYIYILLVLILDFFFPLWIINFFPDKWIQKASNGSHRQDEIYLACTRNNLWWCNTSWCCIICLKITETTWYWHWDYTILFFAVCCNTKVVDYVVYIDMSGTSHFWSRWEKKFRPGEKKILVPVPGPLCPSLSVHLLFKNDIED